jgi:hypothetical protein
VFSRGRGAGRLVVGGGGGGGVVYLTTGASAAEVLIGGTTGVDVGDVVVVVLVPVGSGVVR